MLETLAIAAENAVLGTISNLLTDFIYHGYSSAKNLKRKSTKAYVDIQEKMRDFTAAYKGSVIDSGVFLDYLKLPQISDTIGNYIDYIALGKVRKGEINLISRDQVVKYLSDNAYDRYSDEITVPAKKTINQFFEEFLGACTEVYYKSLSRSEKTTVFFINEKMGKLESILTESLKRKVEENETGFLETAVKYGSILRRNHQRIFVYGYQELDMEDFYVSPDLTKKQEEVIIEFMPAKKEAVTNPDMDFAVPFDKEWNRKYKYLELFDKENIVYVVGGAGYGKTILLNNLIINSEKLNILHSSEYVVIYCDLKSYYKYSRDHAYPIGEFLVESMIEETGMSRTEINESFLDYFLKTGRCLILLDALDEVPKQYRETLHKKITSYFMEFHPNNKICITSRSRGFIPKFNIEVFELMPLNKNQIEQYLDNMIKLKYFHKKDKEAFLEQAEVLIRKKFLNSFLILSLLVNIFRAEKELPRTKAELYGKCFSYVSRDRELEKTSEYEKYNWNDVSKIMKDSTFIELSKMACPNNHSISEEQIVETLTRQYTRKFGSEDRAEAAVQEFLKFCSERTELFVPASAENQYKFFHRSFFEYFYARYVARKQPEEIVSEFFKFDLDSEVQELTAAMIKNEDEEKYQRLMEYLLDEAKREAEFGKNVSESMGSSVFDLLTLVMQVVDDESYKAEYCKMFLAYPDRFTVPGRNEFSSVSCQGLHNERIVKKQLEDYFYKKEDQFEILYETYKEYAAASLVGDLERWTQGGSHLKKTIFYFHKIRYEYFKDNFFAGVITTHPKWEEYFLEFLKKYREQNANPDESAEMPEESLQFSENLSAEGAKEALKLKRILLKSGKEENLFLKYLTETDEKYLKKYVSYIFGTGDGELKEYSY